MAEQTGDVSRKIALFIDFDNLFVGLKSTEFKKFDITLVIQRLLEKGKIIAKKAYADWEHFSDYKKALHEAAVELIEIPSRHYSGKNNADIKMVVDALELCYSKDHLDTFVIASGDSDFSPLVSKLKENNKYVIGMGVKDSTSALLVNNCDEFIYYEDLAREKSSPAVLPANLPKLKAEAFGLLIKSIQALLRENQNVLWSSLVKDTMKRINPSFNEGYYGYGTFSKLLLDAQKSKIIQLEKNPKSGTFTVVGLGEGD
jgi:uncharacterized protein (TIGR00288 family)